MYLDAWENKPPGVAWLSALGLALSAGAQIGAWLMPAVVLSASLAIFFYSVSRLFGPITACTGTLVAATITTLRLYDTPSVNPDCYSAAFDLAACSLWLLVVHRGKARFRLLLALAAGLV